jgi:hypothetical protein
LGAPHATNPNANVQANNPGKAKNERHERMEPSSSRRHLFYWRQHISWGRVLEVWSALLLDLGSVSRPISQKIGRRVDFVDSAQSMAVGLRALTPDFFRERSIS